MRGAVLIALFCGCFSPSYNRTLLRGQVLYGNEGALQDVLVRLVDRNSEKTWQTLTAQNGEYRFTDLPASSYALFFSTDRWIAEASPTVLVAVDGETADQVLEPMVLTPAGALSGQVQAPTPDAALEGIVVNLDAFGLQARADKDGRFDFGRLPVRRYRASAIGPGIVSARQIAVDVAIETESVVAIELAETPAPIVEPNRAPVLAGVTFARVPVDPMLLVDQSGLAPDALIRGGRGRFTCDASDADGDDLVYSWQVSGGVIEQLSPETIVWEAQGGSATIRCTVSDGQGGFATATRKVDVVDYRMAGAAIAGTRVVFSQNDAVVPDFDLFTYDLGTRVYTALRAPGNQIAPQAFGNSVVYTSDENATGDNPRDVYTRTLPAGAPIRLSTSNGVEAYGVGPAGIVLSDNSGATCTLHRAAVTLFETDDTADCDRVVVGTDTVLFREATTSFVRWRLLAIGGLAVDAPAGWSSENGVTAAYADGAYWVAVPSLRAVLRIDEASPGMTPETELSLPELAGTVVASVASDGDTSAASAFDTSGLFGSVRMKRAGLTRNLPATGPRVVLGAVGAYVLFGAPKMFENPPAQALYVYDWEVP